MKKYFLKLSSFDYFIMLLCIFHFIANIVWITLNTAPLPWDQAGHTLISFDFLSFLQGKNTDNFLNISTYYPPFTHLVTAIGMSIFGQSPIIGQLVTTIFFLTAIVFMYLYTNELLKNKAVSALAALLFSLLPLIYASSRWLLLEIPLIASILVSLYFGEKSKHFTNLKYTIFFSIAFAVAILTKWTALVFLLAPIASFLAKRPNFRLLLLSLGVIFVLTYFWYAQNIKNITELALLRSVGEISDPRYIISIQNIIFYIQLIVNFGLTWLGFLFFIVSLAYFIYKKPTNTLLMTLSLLIPYLIFTAIGNKDIRYITPLFPFMTMIISYFLVKMISLRKNLGIFFIGILGLYYLFYFFSLSFGFPLDPKRINYQRAIQIPLLGWIDYINLGKETSGYLAPKFDNTRWPHDQILKDILVFSTGKNINVLLVVDKQNLNLSNLNIAQRKNNIHNLNFSSPYSTHYFKDFEELKKYIAYFHLALIAQHSFGPTDAMRHLKALEQLKQHIQTKGEFQKIKEYLLPDGDVLYMYSTS